HRRPSLGGGPGRPGAFATSGPSACARRASAWDRTGGVTMRILVAYATRHGATRGIAERVAETLHRSGLDVDLRTIEAAERDRALEAYDAYVIGSAAYLGGWLDPATWFVREHRTRLATRPVWLFSSGPVGTELVDAKGRDVLAASAPKEFAEFEH